MLNFSIETYTVGLDNNYYSYTIINILLQYGLYSTCMHWELHTIPVIVTLVPEVERVIMGEERVIVGPEGEKKQIIYLWLRKRATLYAHNNHTLNL